MRITEFYINVMGSARGSVDKTRFRVRLIRFLDFLKIGNIIFWCGYDLKKVSAQGFKSADLACIFTSPSWYDILL